MPYQQDCSVLSLRALNEKAYELILEAPDIVAAAQPGQFVHVSCGEGHLLRRPISICEASGMQLRLVFEVRYLSDQITPIADPTRAGYTFAGWSREDGTQITTGQISGMPAGTLLTAVWIREE